MPAESAAVVSVGTEVSVRAVPVELEAAVVAPVPPVGLAAAVVAPVEPVALGAAVAAAAAVAALGELETAVAGAVGLSAPPEDGPVADAVLEPAELPRAGTPAVLVAARVPDAARAADGFAVFGTWVAEVTRVRWIPAVAFAVPRPVADVC